jgi:hypothetical protein
MIAGLANPYREKTASITIHVGKFLMFIIPMVKMDLAEFAWA